MKIIIIKGKMNSGKTTTAGLVYYPTGRASSFWAVQVGNVCTTKN